MAAVVSEWVEVIVVEGERGAEGVESDDPICMANNNIVVVVGGVACQESALWDVRGEKKRSDLRWVHLSYLNSAITLTTEYIKVHRSGSMPFCFGSM